MVETAVEETETMCNNLWKKQAIKTSLNADKCIGISSFL